MPFLNAAPAASVPARLHDLPHARRPAPRPHLASIPIQRRAAAPDSLRAELDWGVQAIVSWLLLDCFHDGSVSIVAEEDDQTLSSSDGAALLESVVAAVNGCLVEAPKYGLKSLEKELSGLEVLAPEYCPVHVE